MHKTFPLRSLVPLTFAAMALAATSASAQPQATPVAAAPAKENPNTTRVYLATFEHDAAVKPEADLLESKIAEVIGSEQTFSLLSEKELRATLNQAALNAALACQEADCVVKTMGHTRALDAFIAGTVSRRANAIVVTGVMIVPKTGEVLSRRSLVVESIKALQSESVAFAQGLVLGQEGGDRPLTDLRIGVVIDEKNADGTARPGRDVEACAANVLSEADAVLVSPKELSRMKARASGAGTEDDALLAADVNAVDVLLLGTAVWSDATPRGEIFGGMSVTNQQVDLGWQLVSVESGEVLAAKSMAVSGVGHSDVMAQKKARQSLCATLAPVLSSRLKRKVSRGHRFVIDAEGVGGPSQARRVLTQIQSVKRVVRARLRNVNDKKASYDVWIAGGDGLTFADRAKSFVPRMKAVSRDRVALDMANARQ